MGKEGRKMNSKWLIVLDNFSKLPDFSFENRWVKNERSNYHGHSKLKAGLIGAIAVIVLMASVIIIVEKFLKSDSSNSNPSNLSQGDVSSCNLNQCHVFMEDAKQKLKMEKSFYTNRKKHQMAWMDFHV